MKEKIRPKPQSAKKGILLKRGKLGINPCLKTLKKEMRL